ncbi:MAG: MerR family transcriptional regulator [Syntrophales bacterium]|nr:MerR family transcriptional regulator [Syntrophales bacterium]
MDIAIPDKAYFRIGEVSKILGVKPYVVRYWESEFKTLRPVRTNSGQRLYRRNDLQELMVIKNLLYTDRFTISGAKKALLKKRPEETACTGANRDRKELIEVKRRLQQIRDMLS